ncbi:hypothetical protein OKW29_007106 [Paraburkholderia sp. CI3]
MRTFRSNGQVGLEALTMVDLPDPDIPAREKSGSTCMRPRSIITIWAS